MITMARAGREGPPNQDGSPALPAITADLPGIGGRIKQEPSHFIVEEVPLYPPSGSGPHLYVTLTREGMTTKEVQAQLAHLFHVQPDDIGYAGLKDKHARATQTFSIPTPTDADVVPLIEAALPVTVTQVSRHTNNNKLKPGHLLGNRFEVIVTDVAADALPKAQAVVAALKARGLPNYFGPQRFGQRGVNIRQGREVLQGQGPPDRWLRGFLISAYQAYLFNGYLARRIEQGWFQRLLDGDIAKKTDTGGLFEVTDWTVEQPRFERGEITFTGPLFGARMRMAKGEAGALEERVLAEAGITLAMFQHQGPYGEGARRPGKLFLDTLTVTSVPAGLCFHFFLPKGAYATVLLREVMKTDIWAGTEPELP